MRRARRYWRIVATPPPPTTTSLPCAALSRLYQRGHDPGVDEVESRAALQLDRRAGMVGEDKDGVVNGGLLPHQPAHELSPHGPRSGPNMLPAHDGGADTLIASAKQLVVDPRLPVGVAPHAPPGAGQEDPVMKPRAATTQGIVRILIGSGAKPVQRDREVTYTNLRHPVILISVLGGVQELLR